VFEDLVQEVELAGDFPPLFAGLLNALEQDLLATDEECLTRLLRGEQGDQIFDAVRFS